MMITLTYLNSPFLPQIALSTPPDDGMSDGSSHDAFEHKKVAFSTGTTKGRNLLNSEVTRTIK